VAFSGKRIESVDRMANRDASSGHDSNRNSIEFWGGRSKDNQG